MTTSCPCYRASPRNRQTIRREFAELRDRCPALNQILLPDEIWVEAQRQDRAEPDDTYHRSMLVLAYMGGFLHHITWGVHQFLLDGTDVKQAVTKQYRKDLRERWMEKQGIEYRHGTFKTYFGKLAEVLLATWFDEHEYSVQNLAALDGPFDVTVKAANGDEIDVEVKVIGDDNDTLQSIARAHRGENSCYSWSLQGLCDWAIFRTYEAAKQLSVSTRTRAVALLFSGTTWWKSESALKDAWIRWDWPRFNNVDRTATDFISAQVAKYPNLFVEYSGLVSDLDRILVFRLDNDLRLVLEHDHHPRQAKAEREYLVDDRNAKKLVLPKRPRLEILGPLGQTISATGSDPKAKR
jgi:hypothetical protein